MKMKKRIFLLTVLLISAGFLFTSNSFADQVYYICTINEVGGTSWAPGFITLTDTATPAAFAKKGFFFVQAKNNEFLATALTAFSMGANVRVLTDIAEGDFPNINAIFLQP
jgi:hypothetical protein